MSWNSEILARFVHRFTAHESSHPFVEEEYAAYYRPVHPPLPAAASREDGATTGS